MITALWIGGTLVLAAFAFVLLFGAPYLPTLSPQIATALELANLKPGDTLLELGSGDGRVLMAAAEQGLTVIGYELNPLLVLYSWLRTRRYGKRVRVVWGNFWRRPLPPAEAVFVFLLDRYMLKLDNKITQEFDKPVKLISFAFKVPNRKPAEAQNGLFLYHYR